MTTNAATTNVLRLIAHIGGEIPSTLRPLTVDVPPVQVCRYCGNAGRVIEFDADGLPFSQDCPVCTEVGQIDYLTRSI